MENMAQDAPAQGSAVQGSVSESGSVPQQSQPAERPQERTFRQNEVDSIVKRAKSDALESYKRMAQEQPEYLAQKMQDAPRDSSGLSHDEIRRIAAEEANRQKDVWIDDARRKAEESEGQRIANEFLTKVKGASDKYPELSKQMERMDLSKYGYAAQLTNMVENTADVWQHLVSDPFKLATINQMAKDDPQFAYSHLQSLAESLKNNDKAANTRLPNAPLTPLRPSNVGTDNGVLSVKDLRRKYRA